MLFSFSILEIYEAFLNGMCLKFELIKLINKVKNFNMSRCIKARENGCCCLIYMFCAGYVLSCLPFLSDDHQNIHKQLELIQNLKLPPDFVINIKVFLFHLHWYWFFFFPSSFYSNSCFSSSVRIAIWSRGCRVWRSTQRLDSRTAEISGSVRRCTAGRRRTMWRSWRVRKSRSGLDHRGSSYFTRDFL